MESDFLPRKSTAWARLGSQSKSATGSGVGGGIKSRLGMLSADESGPSSSAGSSGIRQRLGVVKTEATSSSHVFSRLGQRKIAVPQRRKI